MKNLILSITLLLIIPSTSFAWGRTGHSLVAEIAFKNLDEKTKANVTKYLDGLSIQDAANWMDDQRSDPSYDYLKPLHYINIPKGEKYNPTSTNNIVSELNRILKDFDKINTLTDDVIKMDLLELFHLIGDLHQPLHCGYGDDKGGNTYQVQFDGKGSNLHKVWDSEIIEYKKISYKDVADGISTFNDNIDILGWLNTNRTLLEDIYPENHIINKDYIESNAAIIKVQLLLAGMRLKSVLEHYFKDFDRTPTFTKKEIKIVEISIDDLDKHINETVKVCTKIYGTKKLSSGGKPTFLNAGGAYPNSPLTILIWGDKLGNFKHNPERYYDGKNVCVTGKLILYRDKPEIVVSKEEEIEVK